MSDLSDWEFRIAKLELCPGDVLVIKGPVPPTFVGWEAVLPGGVRILYIPPDVDLSVLTRAEIEARLP